MKQKILAAAVFFLFAACTAPYAEAPPEIVVAPVASPVETPLEAPLETPVEAPAEPPADAGGEMEVYIFGIGRADAILIATDNHAVLIDTGENQHGNHIVGTLLERGIGALDYLIITHFDRDHVGGAHTVLDWLDVENVIVPNYSRASRHVERFDDALAHRGIQPYVITERMSFALDDAVFLVDPSSLPYFAFDSDDNPDAEDLDEDADFIPTGDDFSIIVTVEHGRNNFLFAADATTHRRQQLLDCPDFFETDFDFFKVHRHGRHDRRAVRFINAVAPRYAVITGFHPDLAAVYPGERPTDERILEALEDAGAKVFFTMSDSFRIISDGENLIR